MMSPIDISTRTMAAIYTAIEVNRETPAKWAFDSIARSSRYNDLEEIIQMAAALRQEMA